ncbi:MAG: UvrD-helicase domain-containing protein [Pseudobdellovibrio sp.]
MSSPSFDVVTQSLLIRAGAGAGKTTTLINTFIQLCEQFQVKHNRLPKVAITTFTRKATQEVKERLSVKALEKNDENLFQHINKKSHVHISTIHGLLTLFIQENADVLGLPQGVKIVDDTIYKKYLKKIIRNLLKSENSYLEILEHYSFTRLVDFVLDGLEAVKQSSDIKAISASELLNVTNTKIETLADQLNAVLEIDVSLTDTWKMYFDYLKLLQKALDSKDVESILNLVEEKPTKPRWNKKAPPFEPAIHESIELFWDQFDLSFADTNAYFESHDQLNLLFAKLVHEVFILDQKQKTDSGEITINDLELFSLQLVRQFPMTAIDFSENFDYYMIDEFQDTSPIQVEILDAIIKNKPHFIVGDPQQSIYLFRGARSEVFLEKQQIAADTTSTLSLKFLDTNYRSQPSLMHFINDYFQKVSPQFEPMKVNPDKDLLSSKITFIQSADEAMAVIHHISSLLNQNVSPKDICVLSRRNYNLLKVAGLAHKLSVPVQLQISAGFDQKREILDLIALLKFLINPHDNENLVLLLRSPWAHLTDLDIASVAASIKNKDHRSLWLALLHFESEIKVAEVLSDYLDSYQKIGVSESFIQFIKQCGFLDFSSAYDSSGKREANFWKFYTYLKQAESLPGFSLGRYIAENFQFLQSDLGSSKSEAIPVAQPDRVSLMTIHASKGLEFDYVIVVGFSEQPLITLYQPLTVNFQLNKFSLAPYVLDESKSVISRWAQKNRQDFNIKELEEHERMLYVALTRARHALTLVAETKSRQSSGSWQKKSFWPEVGTYDESKYDLISEFHESEVNPRLSSSNGIIIIKNKLKFESSQMLQTNVTDTISEVANIAEAKSKVADKLSESSFDSKIIDFLKAKKGTDLHRIFESLQVLVKEDVVIESLQHNFSKDEKKAIDYMLNQSALPLKRLIADGFPEWGFGIKTKSGVLQGQIDLWGIVDHEIYILDYKTGSSAYFDKALQQLIFYGLCLYRMKMIDSAFKLNLAVVYPLEQKTIVRSYSSFNDFQSVIPVAIASLF